MKLYNTLTRTVEDFIPYEKNKVKFYTCGPTVYHFAHIGNMRSYIGHDILDKTLRFLGYDVTRCMNITDVGHLTSDADTGMDKMEIASKKEHKSVLEIANFYQDAFFKDFKLLNCRKPEIVSKATDNIDFYIKIIEDLLNKGYAYKSGGNIYFDTTKLDNYYCLTNNQDHLEVGVRDSVEEDINKKNQADFVLWFTSSKYENHELLWDSPFGRGYPGWHIECSGISIKYLGEYLDIHGGGVDNIFPHHTNEIAQSEAYLSHPWCKYWFHNEYLIEENKKMSKSDGDIITLSSLIEKGYNPLSYRFMCLNSHYRKPLDFSYLKLNQAEETYKKLKNRINNLVDKDNIEDISLYIDKFKEFLSDDLNTANALSLVYEVLKSNLNDSSKLEFIRIADQVLSLDLINNNKELEDEEYILKLIDERNKAKKNKDYELADSIRSDLLDKGIELIDTKEGTKYRIVGE